MIRNRNRLVLVRLRRRSALANSEKAGPADRGGYTSASVEADSGNLGLEGYGKGLTAVSLRSNPDRNDLSAPEALDPEVEKGKEPGGASSMADLDFKGNMRTLSAMSRYGHVLRTIRKATPERCLEQGFHLDRLCVLS